MLPGLPLLTVAGLVVLLLGGAADVGAHLVAAGQAGHGDAPTMAEGAAHGAVFVGMVLIFLGVVADGIRQTRARRDPARRPRKGVA